MQTTGIGNTQKNMRCIEHRQCFDIEFREMQLMAARVNSSTSAG